MFESGITATWEPPPRAVELVDQLIPAVWIDYLQHIVPAEQVHMPADSVNPGVALQAERRPEGRPAVRRPPGRRDRAGCQGMGILVAQHHRQRNQPHGYYGRTDNAGRRGQQRADEHDGNSQTAANRTEQLRHRYQEVLGNLGPLQHDSHENE